MSLLLLQNHVKRDPTAYREEFLLQFRQYASQLEIFRLSPSKEAKTFGELVLFLAQVMQCYPADLAAFPAEMIDLLEKHGSMLDTALRRVLVQSLVLLRNRSQLSITTLLPLFFKLFRCPDKHLRTLLFKHIVSDIKNVNRKHKDPKVNRTLQNFMYGMLQDSNNQAAKKSLDVLIALHKKKIWDDAKTVNVISTACFSSNTKMLVTALQFFLSVDEEVPDSDDENDESSAPSQRDIYNALHKSFKRSILKQKKLKRQMSRVAKKKKSRENKTPGFHALHLLNDPQGFADKLFVQLRKSNERFEVRLMMINLISRLIGTHKLFVLNFYPFIQKFLQPHQQSITSILACAAQACHDLVPPDVVEPIVRTLVDNFVTDRSTDEAVVVGLNTIREICMRMPLVMDATLLQDLTQYKSSRDKGVVMAARSLIATFRQLNPTLLLKKDRGREAPTDVKAREYGQLKLSEGVDGADLLLRDEQAAGEDEEEEEGSDEEGEEETMSKHKRKKMRLMQRRKKRARTMDEDADEEEEEGEEEEIIADDSAKVLGQGKGEDEYEWGAWAQKGSGKGNAKKRTKGEAVVGSGDESGAIEEGEESDSEEEEGDGSEVEEGEDSDSEEDGDAIVLEQSDEEGGSGEDGEEDEEEIEVLTDRESKDDDSTPKLPSRLQDAPLEGVIPIAAAAAGVQPSTFPVSLSAGEEQCRREGEVVNSTSGTLPAVELRQLPSEKAETNGSGDAKGQANGNSVKHMSQAVAAGGVKQLQPDAVRILSEEDFHRIRTLRAKRDLDGVMGAGAKKAMSSKLKSQKRKDVSASVAEDGGSEEEAEEAGAAEFITSTDIEGQRKKRRRELEERLASVQMGREGREKFGGKKKDKTGGSTNKHPHC